MEKENETQTMPTAFPWTGLGTEGMSLRDYFASKAMNGFMGGSWSIESFAELASKSYELADAMMKARESND